MQPEVLESHLLSCAGFRHAFFTRRGGNSHAPFDSLHFGSNGHDEQSLAANVRAAAGVLGVPVERLYAATQVHGREVVALRGGEARDEILSRCADALMSTSAGVACAVKVADCVPILVGDVRSGAVLAIHSGWQGTTLNVVAAAISALRNELGHDGQLVAAIGPHIETCCFEVSDDVAEKLAICAPSHSVVDRSRGPKPHVELRRIVRAQIEAAGVASDAIDDVRGCTKCEAERFFSFRRDRDTSGRMLAAIVAR